jgi:site-specific recombinase XerD
MDEFEAWLQDFGPAAGKTTAYQYRCHAVEFVREFGPPEDATDDTIYRWREWIKIARKNGIERTASVSTTNLKTLAVRWLFTYAIERGFRSGNPTLHLKQKMVPKRLPKPASAEVIQEAREAMAASTEPMAIMDRALFETLYGSMLRRDEAGRLRLRDINLDDMSVTVIGKGNKERKSIVTQVQMRYLSDWIVKKLGDMHARNVADLYGKVAAVLDLQRRKPDAALFYTSAGTPFPALKSPGSAVYDRIQLYVKLAPHRLRHSGATGLWNAGAELVMIKEILGHENIATTLNYAALQRRGMDTLRSLHPADQEI